MSSTGRCQDALFNLYERDAGWSGTEDGPVKKLGITFDQWKQLIQPIIDAVYPIAFDFGRDVGRRDYVVDQRKVDRINMFVSQWPRSS